MTRKDSLKQYKQYKIAIAIKIIKNSGDCYGISCTDCPVRWGESRCKSTTDRRYQHLDSSEASYKIAAEYLMKYAPDKALEILI